ncbi:MAG TPA: hypothetical protein VNC22_20750 [Sporichthya sp.]|jgi:hypothetical protein|nr:hypothetical protein [Sporichthya sp.]
MHRHAEAPQPARLTRATIDALLRLHLIVLVAGVFLFALALTTLAVRSSPERTVNLQFTHESSVVMR